MRQTPLRLTIVMQASELELIERAAGASGASAGDFVRDAALRAARGIARDASSGVPDSTAPLTYPSRRSLRRSIPCAPMPLIEVVRQPSEHLGRKLLAITVGATAADVDGWGTEEAAPPPTQERRLREAHEVWQFVMSVESLETARAWWMGMKEQLGDLTPAEAIAADQASAVMSIARDFVESG